MRYFKMSVCYGFLATLLVSSFYLPYLLLTDYERVMESNLSLIESMIIGLGAPGYIIIGMSIVSVIFYNLALFLDWITDF